MIAKNKKKTLRGTPVMCLRPYTFTIPSGGRGEMGEGSTYLTKG